MNSARGQWHLILLLAVLGLFATQHQAQAQVIITLPTISTFQIDTTVMVPDGGRMLLGGVNRGSGGSISRGVPGLRNIPFAGRGFGNRGIGREMNAGNISVGTQIISLREIEAQVMSEGEAQAQQAAAKNPNLQPAVVRQAQFLSRNIGRRK